MHSIQIHKVIGLLISVFYLIGAWHRGDKPTLKEMRMKLFYSIYYFLLLVASVGGIIKNEKKNDSIFLVELSMGVLIMWINLLLAIWKQNEILNLLNRVCVFSIRNDDDCLTYNAKLKGLIKFAFVFLIALAFASFACVFPPLVRSEKILFIKMVFPLDYKNSEIGFWIATAFLFFEFILTVTFSIFTVLIWYLLLVCAVRYEVLGSDMKNMGRRNGDTTRKIDNMGRVTGENSKVKMTEKQKHINFSEDLKTSIKSHLHIKGCVTVLHIIRCAVYELQVYFTDW